MSAHDQVIALVEDCEARAIGAGQVDQKDIQARGELRVALLDAFAQAQRAKRVAVLMERLHRMEVQP